MNPDLTKVPQVWALYKEVQEYYEKGMRVPDDVTLLWCDDNWGNIRRLPTPEERKRAGGAGIYYHFDYVGGPRNYKWLNTNPHPKVWEQMNLAYEYGADRIWIVNVGDLKPMEFPIEFFLTSPGTRSAGRKRRSLNTRGSGPSASSARSMPPRSPTSSRKYAKYNGRRKPELLDPDTFSLVNYQEADRVQAEWQDARRPGGEDLTATCRRTSATRSSNWFCIPTKASARSTELYIAAGKNQLYAHQGRASANDLAAQRRSTCSRPTPICPPTTTTSSPAANGTT